MSIFPRECVPPDVWSVSSLGNLTLLDDEVHLWRAPLPPVGVNLKPLLSLLAPDERSRTDAYTRPEPRAHFIAARGMLRLLLAAYLGMQASEVPIVYAAYGKPALGGEHTALRFNLAHSGEVALFAVARGHEVGVDVERKRNVAEMLQIATLALSAEERGALRGMEGQRFRDAFFRAWTRKEALLKGIGRGITDLQTVSVDPQKVEQGVPIRIEPSLSLHAWYLSDLDPCDGYAGCLAVADARLRVDSRDMQLDVLGDGE